jgi:tRNA pseudouridine38-40 synthase
MPRFALEIEYHGGPFAGWQRQEDHPSVQAAVEAALRRLQPDAPGIAAAGRTDAGVHATGQVAHCDLARDWDPFRLSEALNWHLKPAPVAILRRRGWPMTSTPGFPPSNGATCSACCRAGRPPRTMRASSGRCAIRWIWTRCAPVRAHLIGHHDFTTFRATLCQANSPMKTLDQIAIDAHPVPQGTEYRFTLRARSFLHNQVRSIVGTLERVGSGAWPPDRVAQALAARDRAACGPVAPPDGLYLTGVGYPADPFA